jgi:hypothetical protein
MTSEGQEQKALDPAYAGMTSESQNGFPRSRDDELKIKGAGFPLSRE